MVKPLLTEGNYHFDSIDSRAKENATRQPAVDSKKVGVM
jgi:hypothetical protein